MNKTKNNLRLFLLAKKLKNILKIFSILITAIFISGFFIGDIKLEAVDEMSSLNYKVISALDTTKGENIYLTDSEIKNLQTLDTKRVGIKADSWPNNGSYDESKYVEYSFDYEGDAVPENAVLEEVLLSINLRRYGTLSEAKFEIIDGLNVYEELVDICPRVNEDCTTEIDITSYVDSISKLDNLKVRLLAYRSGEIDTKTTHDFIGLSVYYTEDENGGDGEDGGGDGDDGDGQDEGDKDYIEIDSDIEEDTYWSKDNIYVISTGLIVEEGATLFISEGTIVKFKDNSSLFIRGAIRAIGTKEEPIHFTSISDDSVGGDTNEDGDDTSPKEGDWDYLLFSSTEGISELNYVNNYFSKEGILVYSNFELSINNFISDNRINLYKAKANISNSNILSIDVFDKSEAVIENSTIESDRFSTINVYDNSLIKINNSYVRNENESSAINVYQNSEIHLDNTSVFSDNEGILIYDNSKSFIKNLKLSCDGNGLHIYKNSSLNLDKGNISCLGAGLLFFSDVDVDISGIKVSGSLDAGILANNNFIGDIKVTKSEITNNEYGFVVFDSFIFASENHIHNNEIFGAYTFKGIDIDFIGNYWGDKNGPTHSSNASGLGDKVSDNIIFDPFLKYNPLEKRKDPIIIIPGTTGTYLHKNYDDHEEIWPNLLKLMSPTSIADNFLNDLALREDGTENPLYPIKTGDMMRKIVNVDIFDKLISDLENDGYVEDENLFVFPYDWRLSVSHTAGLLENKIREIKDKTNMDKVDIVAHSMGGLVSKKYIADFGKESVDQLIFLGTPQLGAPKAFKVLMFGDSMGFKFLIDEISFLNHDRAKFMSQNMPSVYELLPSRKYIEKNGEYIIDSRSKDNSSLVLSYDQTKNLMIEEGRNHLMYPLAEELHLDIDDFDLSGIDAYNFVGCGSATLGSVELTRKLSWKKLFLGHEDDYNIRYKDGDGTVPFVSADKTFGAQKFYANGISHEILPSSKSISDAIVSILGDKLITFDDTLYDSDRFCEINGKVVSTHSPVELHIYDEEGSHTGPDENGDIEYGIDGVEYDLLGGVSYTFLPNGRNYKIINKATDIGGYDLKIEEQNGNDITSTNNWTLVPLKTLNTNGEIWIGEDYDQDNYVLKIDDDGDGIFDNNYESGFDGTSYAEEMTETKEEKTSNRHTSFGSFVSDDKSKEEKIIPKEVFALSENKNTANVLIDNKESVNYKVEEVEISEELDLNEIKDEENQINKQDKDNLSASVYDSGVRSEIIWVGLIIFGLLLIILAKKLTKL